jgi:protein-tyrosine phosphatase
MQRLLFVCLGNICRSPVAEGIMLHLNSKYNYGFDIDSAGTAGYHIGEAPDRRTIANAKKNGVDLSTLRARQFTAVDFKKFDLIFAMDQSNYQTICSLASNNEEKTKVKLFLDFVNTDAKKEVPDPYYGNEEGFENVFQLVYMACEKLCEKLKHQ